MNKSRETKREFFFRSKNIVLGGVVTVLALFVTTQAVAAPTTTSAKSKVTARATTALDPIALRPSWIFRSKAPTAAPVATSAGVARPADPALTTIGQRLGIFSAHGSNVLVVVPNRPQPRSPFMPPLTW